MKKFIATLLAVIMVSQLAFANAQTATNNPSQMACVLGLMGQMDQLGTHPEVILQGLFACAGDQSWMYLAPFLGGALIAIVVQINGPNNSTGLSNLALYNMIMDMLKQAVGELMGLVDTTAFRYRYSTQ